MDPIDSTASTVSLSSLRAWLMEQIIDAAASRALGIAGNCLQLLRDDVDNVIRSHAVELHDPNKVRQALSAHAAFLDRMVQDAITKNYTELHEDTRDAARKKCGLIFWCA
jgi:hypothetical protein